MGYLARGGGARERVGVRNSINKNFVIVYLTVMHLKNRKTN